MTTQVIEFTSDQKCQEAKKNVALEEHTNDPNGGLIYKREIKAFCAQR